VIRTPDQRLRVYVSGDPLRLHGERQSAREAVESLHLTPVTVDVEGPPGRALSTAYLSQSNAFVGVYEARPGEPVPGGGPSLQECELDAARDLPKLLYVRVDGSPAGALPSYLAAAAREGAPLKRFSDEAKLGDMIRDDLAALLSQRFAASFAPPPEERTDAVPRVRLPAQLTPFVGRAKEVGEVASLVASPSARLVTLSGPGGIGKSRLAYEVAATVAGEFPDGVAVVPLAAVADPQLVVPAIARVLDVKESAERTLVENLKELLRAKRMLLLLDNFEHVVAAAHLVAGVLEASPHLKLLVTSRAVLFVRGEIEYRVPALALPGTLGPCTARQIEEYEAVRLFVERAQAADPSFALADSNAAAVAEICARLDGLPLAIELAAARTRLLSPEGILARLTHRLQLLTGGPVDLPERQQTLRATLDWDYDLLEAEEQEVFRKLAVFSGGFTLGAAERVLGPETDVFEVVDSLTSKSLLMQDEADGETRFSMLRTLREYAHEKLEAAGEGDEVRRCHAGYFLRLAEEAGPELKGPDQIRWLGVLDREADNMRAAVRWAGDSGDAETELRLTAALGEYWEFRAHLSEGQRALEEALARWDSASALLRAPCMECAAVMARGQGEYKRAVSFADQAIALYGETGDDHALSRALKQRGVIASERGDKETARSFYVRSLEIKQRIGDRRGIAEAQNNLGVLARLEGDLDGAIERYGSALEYFRDAGDQKAIARILMNLGEARMEKGELAEAEGLIAESLRLCLAIGSDWDIADLLELMATVQSGFGNPTGAAVLFGAGQALRDLLGAPLPEAEQEAYDTRLADVKADLDAGAFEAAWEEGRAMRVRAAVEYALGLQRSAAAG
jgi:predicted ATPase